MALTYAEFCAGYGGLGLAVEEVFGAELKWYSEFDPAPSKIMAHQWPGVPNLGDMTAIDWTTVEPVDILSGGTPCQDLSAAGRRKGMTEGTRSNLWVHMREAIAVIKPRHVVWENVRGAYSAEASSDLEQCPGCVGDTSDGRVFLRALGRVLGDLSDLGYDCQWRGLRAAGVGACHGRYRVFVVGTLRDAKVRRRDDARHTTASGDQGRERQGATGRSTSPTAHRDSSGRIEHGRAEPVRTEHATTQYTGNDATADADSRHDDGRLSDTQRGQERGEATAGSVAGLGATADASGNGRIGRKDLEGERWVSGVGGEAFHHPSDGCASRLDTCANPESIGRGEGRTESARLERGSNNALGGGTNWGEYEPAIRRWERSLGRPAPRPTEPTGRAGGHRLSPRFTEWMMGLDDGWVTAPEIGLTRNEQLKACGNGVVPQQAAAALRDMVKHNKEGG